MNKPITTPNVDIHGIDREIPIKKHTRKKVKNTTKPTPKSKKIRKDINSKQSVRVPKNKIFTNLKKIISTVTKNHYYSNTYGWNTPLLNRHLYLAQKIRDEVKEEANRICKKKIQNDMIFKLWSDKITESSGSSTPTSFSQW